MKILIILCIVIGYNTSDQETFETAQVFRYNNEKVYFNFHSFGKNKEDSAKVYMAYKPATIDAAIQLMKSKGWELINVKKDSPGGNSGEFVITANFKRRRKIDKQ